MMTLGRSSPSAVKDSSGKTPNFLIDYVEPNRFKITHQITGRFIMCDKRYSRDSRDHKREVVNAQRILEKSLWSS